MDKKESEHHERDLLLPRDRLSTLPVEILSAIFKLAYTPVSPPTGPVCRALLPFDRSTRFRRLEVKSGEKLGRLAELIEKGALGGYVREMKLEEVDGESAAGLKDRQLKSFFANLPHLSHLELGKGCQLTLRLVLSNSLARASLRNLTHLTTEAVQSKNPFDPAPYRLLNSYPALHSLSTTSEIPWHQLKRVELPKKKKVEPLSGLVELAFTSPGADLPLVSFFLQSCPVLQALSLSVTSCPADFRNLLPLLPAGLKRLELRTILAPQSDSNRPCDDLLSRFTALEHLYLGEGLFRSSFFDLVRTFPHLTSLGFGPWVMIDCKDLLALVDGPTRFLQLKTLILDVVKGKRGWRTDIDSGGVLHPQAHPRWHTGPGWEIPDFTPPSGIFSDLDVDPMIRKAEQNGVKVEGSTVEAVKIMDDWYHEYNLAARVYALETGDFTKLREMMGNKFVDDSLFEVGFDDGFSSGCGDYDNYGGRYGYG